MNTTATLTLKITHQNTILLIMKMLLMCDNNQSNNNQHDCSSIVKALLHSNEGNQLKSDWIKHMPDTNIGCTKFHSFQTLKNRIANEFETIKVPIPHDTYWLYHRHYFVDFNRLEYFTHVDIIKNKMKLMPVEIEAPHSILIANIYCVLHTCTSSQ